MTDTRFKLHLLGPPSLELEGKAVHLATRKALAILAYIAVHREGASRAELASLLWPENAEDQARASLRQELSRLAGVLGDALQKPNQQVLRFDPEHIEIDLWAFQDAQRQGDAKATLERYRGVFLQGLQLREAVEFEDWQAQVQGELQQHYLNALDTLARHEEAAQHLGQALAYRRQAIAADPLAETQYLEAMRLSEQMGDRAGALRLYQTLERVLREELGVEPSPAAQAFARGTTPSAPKSVIPAPSTPLVGRNREIPEVIELLSRPDCRLVNLVGAGGIGKTRLAQGVAQQLSANQPLYWANLQGRKLIPSIAEALSLSFFGRGDMREAVLHQLRQQNAVLVLGEAEDLEETGELEALLREIPGLKLLVTSRERLHLRSEWVYEVHGLRVPEEGRVSAANPAAELFRGSALRVQPGFSPTPADWQAIGEICRLLSGLPLAIELAAAWVRLMSCEEIAQHLSQNLDLLEGSGADLPERQRSLRAVMESTLERLGPEERQALLRLAVFRGGFDLTAARSVAGATPMLLAALTDRALIQRENGAGYRMLEVIRQYLYPQAPLKAKQAHARYYHDYLTQRVERLRGGDQSGALKELDAAYDNLRTAWVWAAEHQQHQVLAEMAEGMFLLHELRGLFREGVELFAQATQVSDERTRGHILSRKGRLHYRLVEFAEALEHLEQATRIARAHQESNEIAFCLNNLGLVELGLGHPAEAKRYFEESLNLRKAAGSRWGAANSLYNLGLLASHVGETQAAHTYFQEALDIFRSLGDLRGTGLALIGLGQAWASQGQYAVARELLRQALSYGQQLGDRFTEANAGLGLGTVAGIEFRNEECRQRLQESLEAAYQTGDQIIIGRALTSMGRLAIRDGEYQRAIKIQRQALECFQNSHYRWGEALAYNHLGRSYIRIGETSEGQAHYRLALQEALGLQAAPMALRALAGLAPFAKDALAQQIYTLVLHHPSTDHWVREEVRRTVGHKLESPQDGLEVVARAVLQTL